MRQNAFQIGYQRGRLNGYQSGKSAGFQLGFQETLAVKQASPAAIQLTPDSVTPLVFTHPLSEQDVSEIDAAVIVDKFQAYNFREHLSACFGQEVLLQEQTIKGLKDSFKSSIWQMDLLIGGKVRPIVLKVIKPNDDYALNEIELNVYTHASPVLQELMPQVYTIEHNVNGPDHWVFLEYIQPLEEQVVFHPKHFDQIIPSLAVLHARTFEGKFFARADVLLPWLPMFHSADEFDQKIEKIEKTKTMLTKSMKNPALKPLVAPLYSRLMEGLQKGPVFFSPMVEAGQSIIHNDLQMKNIGWNQLNENQQWAIRFIDWEGIEYAPCWIDMYNLVGVFLSYRGDWRHAEEDIIMHCSQLYAAEMKKYGITFKLEPDQLFKMAYLQRVLERDLLRQLIWATEGRDKGKILDGTLDRLARWGNELHLF